ncbi:MAG: hypothetical protein ACMG57_01170 [Candidatus Dojkabacteria bacterium]
MKRKLIFTILIIIIAIIALFIYSRTLSDTNIVGGGDIFFYYKEDTKKCDLVVAKEKQSFLFETEEDCKLANNIK